jgi:hypothetical protein
MLSDELPQRGEYELKSPNNKNGLGSCSTRYSRSDLEVTLDGDKYIQQIVTGLCRGTLTATASRGVSRGIRENITSFLIYIETPLAEEPSLTNWSMLLY